MSSATSIGVRNWPRSARAPSSSAASPASRRPAASESRSTALGYRVCPAASGGRGPTVTRGSRAWCGVWWPWASPALPGPRGHCRLNEDSTRPGRLSWPGALAGVCGLLRASALGSLWPGAAGSLTPRGVDLPVAREYCCGACGPAAGHLRNLGPLVPPGRGSGAPGVYTPRSGSWLAGARQAAAPVSVPHMALSFSIMLERLEGSAAVMASWRERIKRRYSP